MATSAETARKTRAVANQRSVRRTSAGPEGERNRHKNRCRKMDTDKVKNQRTGVKKYYCSGPDLASKTYEIREYRSK